MTQFIFEIFKQFFPFLRQLIPNTKVSVPTTEFKGLLFSKKICEGGACSDESRKRKAV